MLSEIAAPTTDVQSGKPMVLVVDDEYGPREMIATCLDEEFVVETAERALEALHKIETRSYSVVVLDIRMPEMDGIRALEELRKIDPYVSVIMLTGYGTLLTAQQSMVAGANQYLRKPPEIEELMDAVRQQAVATRLRRAQAQAKRQSQGLNTALKREIEQNEPHKWQAGASVELIHDLNRPLAVAISYAALVAEEAKILSQSQPELAKRLVEYSTVGAKAAEYCRYLADKWRLASPGKMAFEHVDLVQVVRDVRDIIFLGDVMVSLQGLKQAEILGSRFELMRIFHNFFENSLEAGARHLVVVFSLRGDVIDITVVDNGAGMNADRLSQALHGDFSSKAGSVGLGLSICRRLASAHGATFTIDSSVGKGSTVKLSFPVTSEPRSQP